MCNFGKWPSWFSSRASRPMGPCWQIFALFLAVQHGSQWGIIYAVSLKPLVLERKAPKFGPQEWYLVYAGYF